MRGLVNARRNRRGTSTLEFALMLPLVMVFFAGIVQYSFFFFVDQSLQTFVTYAARSAVIEAQANSANTQYFSASGTNFDAKTGFGSLLQVTPALDPSTLKLTIYETQGTKAQGNAGITTITATATYPWYLPLPATNGTLKSSSSFSFAN